MVATLAEFFGVEDVDFELVDVDALISSTAIVVVDCQRNYCDPTYIHMEPIGVAAHMRRERAARRISSILPHFRDAGFPVFVVYNAENGKTIADAHGGFHIVEPAQSDIVRPKNARSFIAGSSLKYTFKDLAIQRFVSVGFYTDQCIMAGAVDGTTGRFRPLPPVNSCVLEDLTEPSGLIEVMDEWKRASLNLMRDKGVLVAKSPDFMNFVQEIRDCQP